MLWVIYWCPEEDSNLGDELLYILVNMNFTMSIWYEVIPKFGTKLNAQTQLSQALARKRYVELSTRCAQEVSPFVG